MHGDFKDYEPGQIEKIKATVAAIVGCSSDEIFVGEIHPSGSFLLALSINNDYVGKLLEIVQEDKAKLIKLNIDYFIVDLTIVHLECLKGKNKIRKRYVNIFFPSLFQCYYSNCVFINSFTNLFIHSFFCLFICVLLFIQIFFYPFHFFIHSNTEKGILEYIIAFNGYYTYKMLKDTNILRV